MRSASSGRDAAQSNGPATFAVAGPFVIVPVSWRALPSARRLLKNHLGASDGVSERRLKVEMWRFRHPEPSNEGLKTHCFDRIERRAD